MLPYSRFLTAEAEFGCGSAALWNLLAAAQACRPEEDQFLPPATAYLRIASLDGPGKRRVRPGSWQMCIEAELAWISQHGRCIYFVVVRSHAGSMG